jgi:hypothetical protein
MVLPERKISLEIADAIHVKNIGLNVAWHTERLGQTDYM